MRAIIGWWFSDVCFGVEHRESCRAVSATQPENPIAADVGLYREESKGFCSPSLWSFSRERLWIRHGPLCARL